MQPSFQNLPPPASSFSFFHLLSTHYPLPLNHINHLIQILTLFLPHFIPAHLHNITPSVPFAALSDPNKLFDGLDVTYPPEKFLAQLSARVTFQLGPQPTDLFAYSTWHHRRTSLLYCSLTGTALNWYDRLPQTYR